MATVAGLQAIATAGLQPEDIDVVILGTLSSDYLFPGVAHHFKRV